MRAALPPDESERLAALERYEILDSAPEPAFDDLAALASFICETPIGLVSLVDRDRQWFKARHGLDVTEMHRDIAFCSHAILQEEVFVVNDTRLDQRFADNPLVLEEPQIRFYAGAPLITPEGHHLGTLCTVDMEPRNLSDEQRRLLEGLARQVIGQLELRRNLRELRRSNHSKDRMFTLISHDLRSPLQSILGFSELLHQRLGRLSTEQIRGYNDRVLSAARRVHRMLENLLQLARCELGEVQLRPRPVRVDWVIEEVLAVFGDDAAGKSVELVHTPAPSVMAQTDPQALQPILRNLMSNAIKFCHPEGRVEVEAQNAGERITVTVRDSGVGMSPEHLDRVLTGHPQDSAEGTSGERGTGLGMMLVHRLVDQLCGELGGESELGKGSSFVLTLPASASS